MKKNQSQEPISGKPDVLIIGGGIMGLCTAYYAAKRGAKVTLLEKGEIGAGATYGNAGLVVPSHILPLAAPSIISKGLRWMLDPESPFYIRPRWDPELFRWLWTFRKFCTEKHAAEGSQALFELNVASAQLYRELKQDQVIDDCYVRKGLLYLYEQEKNYRQGIQEAEHLRSSGFKMQVLDTDSVRSLVPSASDEVAGGVLHLESGHVIPDRLVACLLKSVKDLGVEIASEVQVTDLRIENRRIVEVQTHRGGCRGEEIVLAAGALTPSLLKRLGIRIPLQPAKGYSLSVKVEGEMPSLPMILSEGYVAVTPMDDRLRFAGTLELTGVDYSIDPRRIEGILKSVRRFLPGLGAWETLETWAGLRPCLPDGLPVIDKPRGIENLTVSAGHAKIGILLGPITGKLTAQLAMREKPDLDLSAVRLERFG